MVGPADDDRISKNRWHVIVGVRGQATEGRRRMDAVGGRDRYWSRTEWNSFAAFGWLLPSKLARRPLRFLRRRRKVRGTDGENRRDE